MTQVKICGITNLEDGLNAIKLGADYIGFVFYDKSPRCVTREQAKYLSQRLSGVKKVGLFVNESYETVRKIKEEVGLDVLQFHGHEKPDFCSAFGDIDVWKAIRVKNEASLAQISDYSVDAIVLDAHVEGKMGGTGRTFDWDLAIKAQEYGKYIMLAGGLDPSNVAEAIVKVGPYGVDVSSGVEQEPGKKSYEKMKAFIDIAKIPSVLLKIVKQKEKEVEMLYNSGQANRFLPNLKQSERSFHDAISAPGFNLIAEFKITSPSNRRKGNPDFRPDAIPEEIAMIYQQHGASAVSVLTDANFKGEIGYLERIRKVIDLPLLRKDFIIDPIQIEQARYYGADAVLLIAAILDIEQMRNFISIADEFSMDCLVESHNREELDKSIAAGARIYGINNRNLHDRDFPTDRRTTLDLLKYIPEGKLIVTESGILTREHVIELSDPRINAMLVGETLMKADDIASKMHELRQA